MDFYILILIQLKILKKDPQKILLCTNSDQWWKVTYIYLIAVIKYNFEVLILSFYATLYFFSTTLPWKILYVLLHYINLTATDTESDISINN